MGPDAEEAALAAPHEAGLRVLGRDFALALQRAGNGGLDQCGVDQPAGLQAEAAEAAERNRR